MLLCGGHFAYYRTNSNTPFFWNDRLRTGHTSAPTSTGENNDDYDDGKDGDGMTGDGATGYDDDDHCDGVTKPTTW